RDVESRLLRRARLTGGVSGRGRGARLPRRSWSTGGSLVERLGRARRWFPAIVRGGVGRGGRPGSRPRRAGGGGGSRRVGRVCGGSCEVCGWLTDGDAPDRGGWLRPGTAGSGVVAGGRRCGGRCLGGRLLWGRLLRGRLGGGLGCGGLGCGRLGLRRGLG